MKKNLSRSSHVLLGAVRESGGLDSFHFTPELEMKGPVRAGRGDSIPCPIPHPPLLPHPSLQCCWCPVPSESLSRDKLSSASLRETCPCVPWGRGTQPPCLGFLWKPPLRRGRRSWMCRPRAGRAFPWGAGQGVWGMLVKCGSGKPGPPPESWQGKSWRRRSQRGEVLSWEMRNGTPGKNRESLGEKAWPKGKRNL